MSASVEALALASSDPDEASVGARVRASFQLPAGASDALRLRFPQLTLTDGVLSIAPFVASPQAVSQERAAATFVVDYDEPSVVQMLAEVPAEARTPKGLEAFVAGVLEETNSRPFDIASRVATLRKGDCTEHAVLLTALLRASGYSARVVVGVVVLLNPEFAQAAGHAWVEVAEEGHWRRLDAALYRDSTGAWESGGDLDVAVLRRTLRLYLPTIVLESEGPNFARDLVQYAAKLTPTQLTLERWDGS